MSVDERQGRSSEARARRRRSAITLLLVLLMLFFAAWYAMSYIRADAERRTASTPTSSTSTCGADPAQVDVNVYNATNREGLAAQVARDLRARGFVIKTVANDPKQVDVTGRGQLRHGTAGAKGAELVARHVGDFEDTPDERARTSVDVVLGPDYRHLVDEERASTC